MLDVIPGFRSISKRSLSTETKAISIPEKKAESNNISRIINTEVIIRNDRYFLRESVEFSGRSPVSAGPV